MISFHHVGFVVSDIISFEKRMIYEIKISEIFDPVQNARLALYSNFDRSSIELIQPMNEKAFTWNFLQKNGSSFHHLCYHASKENINRIVSSHQLLLILGPLPAVLFSGKNVVFYYTRNKNIVEFLIDPT